ncbi:hypothetical protein [Chryseobacterium populi]|uniref:Uncharacterized protein n=1 Tax=Chryseobacterium populi TaxID=1144316 RepID=J3CM75_9FLAO|nr:hypothetical protein [Chryseobacterium populi]EJL74469.1 hypothetical protein PMI13_01209 [Chryseobacterium populi]
METTLQHQQLQFSEVYIADITALKDIFLQASNLKRVNEIFGIPFLLVKKKENISGFASLVINETGTTDFKVYHKPDLKPEEKEAFTLHARKFFKRNDSGNYRKPEQLKSSIDRMINWLSI